MRSAAWMLCAIAGAGCAGVAMGGTSRGFEALASDHTQLELRVVDGQLRVLAAGRLDGQPATWMVDTGTSAHVILAGEVARRGIHTSQSRVELVDATGVRSSRSMTIPVAISVFASEHAEPAPQIVFEGQNLPLTGVTGMVSPQHLARDGAAIDVDLRQGVLARFLRDAADRTPELSDDGVVMSACSTGGDQQELDFVPLVVATIDGVRARMLVDTGRPTTTLFAASAPGVHASMRAASHSLFVGPVDALDVALVPDVMVDVAGVSQRVRVMVAAGPRVCEADGSLGLDVLRGCRIVLDDQGGTLSCSRPLAELDTAPILTRGIPTPIPADLPPPVPRAAGSPVRLGCDVITEADVAAWAHDHHVTAEEGERSMIRERVIARIDASEDEIARRMLDAAITRMRAQLHLDEAAFDAQLARSHISRAEARVTLLTAMLEGEPPPITEAAIDEELARTHAPHPTDRATRDAARTTLENRASTAATDALIERTRDRLGRVPLAEDGGRCVERWPAYHLEEVRFTGLAPEEEDPVRLSLARWIDGARITLGDIGYLPQMFAVCVGAVFTDLHLVPKLVAHEEGSTLRVDVTLERQLPVRR